MCAIIAIDPLTLNRLRACHNGGVTLTFDIGDPHSPRGHALLYFRDTASGSLYATYVLSLPVRIDISKYLPPMVSAQFEGMMGGAQGETLAVFAAPPMPEEIEGAGTIERLARLRQDDLLNGGEIDPANTEAAMRTVGDIVHEYAEAYHAYLENAPAVAIAEADREQDAVASSDVHRVLFELLSDRDRLAELSKLVGTLRFAAEQHDAALRAETEMAMAALETLLPDHYWVGRLRTAAAELTDDGDMLSRLLIERCYKLLEEDFDAVRTLEERITELSAGRSS